MADKITFSGVELRKGAFSRSGARSDVRLHFRADYTAAVAQHFGWPEDYPDEFGAASLVGGITAARAMVLTPHAPELRKHEVQMECSAIDSFKASIAKDKDGEPVGTNLWFIMTVTELGAESKARHFLDVIGDAQSQLVVHFERQQHLDEQPEDDRQMTLGAEAEEEEEGGEEEAKEEPALASAVSVAGNMDRLKKERRKRQRPSAEGLTSTAEIISEQVTTLRKHQLDEAGYWAVIEIVDKAGVIEGKVAAEVAGRGEFAFDGGPYETIDIAQAELSLALRRWADANRDDHPDSPGLAAVLSWAMSLELQAVGGKTESEVAG